MVPILKFKLSFTDSEPKQKHNYCSLRWHRTACEPGKHVLPSVLSSMTLSLFLNFKLHLYVYRVWVLKIPPHEFYSWLKQTLDKIFSEKCQRVSLRSHALFFSLCFLWFLFYLSLLLCCWASNGLWCLPSLWIVPFIIKNIPLLKNKWNRQR